MGISLLFISKKKMQYLYNIVNFKIEFTWYTTHNMTSLDINFYFIFFFKQNSALSHLQYYQSIVKDVIHYLKCI